MAQDFKIFVEAMAQGGPYAVIVAMGWWILNQDRHIRELTDKVFELGMGNVQAMGGLKASVDGLEKTLTALAAAKKL